jgi:uncharacterized membrane protein
MRLLKAVAPAWIFVILLAGFSLWARTQLPDAPLAVHFNAHFEPNRYWPRDKALFRPLFVVAAILAALTVAPFVLPPKGALLKSAPAYGAVCTATAAFFAAVMGSMVARDLGWPVHMPQVMAVCVGLLLLVIGNFMSKVRYNLLFGVRTPWTLSNEMVWDKTHRFAAPLFMLGGLFILLGVLAPPGLFIGVMLIGVLVPALAATAYSYILWSRLPDADKHIVRGGL